MKLILLFSIFFSLNASSAEVKLLIAKDAAFTGEILSARVRDYQGPNIVEKTLGDSLHILRLTEEEAEIVFLRKPSVNTLALNETDYLVWNPIEVTETKPTENIILNAISFDVKNHQWIYALLISLVLLVVGITFYLKKIKPLIAVKKERKRIKEELFQASTYLEIASIWKNKHSYIDAFPFIEEDFNTFEVTFYQYAFKPDVSAEELKEITKSYAQFLEQVRGGKYGV